MHRRDRRNVGAREDALTEDDGAPAGAQPARFDTTLNAWVLSHYADVRAALDESRLVVHGTPTDTDATHDAGRGPVARPFSADALADWREPLRRDAERLVDGLPWNRPVDLAAMLFVPWSLDVASRVVRVPKDQVDEGVRLARTIFLEAAHASDGAPTPSAIAAAGALGALLTPHGSTSGSSIDVQAWVALTQSLPATLSSMWLALLAHPEQHAILCAAAHDADAADAMTRATAELLRFAGPAQAVFRTVRADLTIGAAHMRAHDRVILLLGAANRDPSHMPDAHRLDVTRRVTSHLALGAGSHRCPGASLVRLATAVATEALVRRAPGLTLHAGAMREWIGGLAIRAPSTVWVTIRPVENR